MKFIIYFFLSLTTLMLLIPDLYSQNPVNEGYIVTKQGDTIHGLIDYRDWELNTNNIIFKSHDQVEPISYSPNDIKSFSVKNEHYQAAIVDLEVSPRMLNELNNNAALEIVKDTVFLQAVLKGEKSLFAYVDLFGRENLYIEQNSGFELLGYKKYRVKQQLAEAHVVENKRFIGQLMIYLSDCETITNRLQKARYSQKNLESIFLDYYECTGSSPDEAFENKKLKFELGLLGGLSLTKISFSGGFEKEYLSGADFSMSTNPTFGIFMDVVLLRKQEKWSVYNEIIYTSYLSSGSYTEYKHADNYTDYEIEIGASYLTMNNMIRYRVLLNRSKLFFNAGISNGLLIDNTNNQKSVTNFFSTVREKEGLALESFRAFETGFIAGIGFNYNRLTIEARGIWGNGMSTISGLKSKTTRYVFLLTYRLN